MVQKLLDRGASANHYDWYISADKIFHSEIEALKDFSKILSMEFHIERFSLFDKAKVSDSAVLSRDVRIYMGSGKHCAMIQGRLAKGVVIPKITVKKTTTLMKKIETLETKEFSQCIVQSFSVVGDIVVFSFRYSSYSDSYTDFSEKGTKAGNAAVSIDLAKFEIKDS
jgi:hypothetical protein